MIKFGIIQNYLYFCQRNNTFYSFMKRICFVVDSIFSIGGVQRVTAVIAKELAKDYDVSIVTFDKPEQMDTTLYQLSESNINYRFFAYPQVGKIKTFFCNIERYLCYRRHRNQAFTAFLSPNIAVPMRTQVLPSAIASL